MPQEGWRRARHWIPVAPSSYQVEHDCTETEFHPPSLMTAGKWKASFQPSIPRQSIFFLISWRKGKSHGTWEWWDCVNKVMVGMPMESRILDTGRSFELSGRTWLRILDSLVSWIFWSQKIDKLNRSFVDGVTMALHSTFWTIQWVCICSNLWHLKQHIRFGR